MQASCPKSRPTEIKRESKFVTSLSTTEHWGHVFCSGGELEQTLGTSSPGFLSNPSKSVAKLPQKYTVWDERKQENIITIFIHSSKNLTDHSLCTKSVTAHMDTKTARHTYGLEEVHGLVRETTNSLTLHSWGSEALGRTASAFKPFLSVGLEMTGRVGHCYNNSPYWHFTDERA